jgi:hypothetical protein
MYIFSLILQISENFPFPSYDARIFHLRKNTITGYVPVSVPGTYPYLNLGSYTFISFSNNIVIPTGQYPYPMPCLHLGNTAKPKSSAWLNFYGNNSLVAIYPLRNLLTTWVRYFRLIFSFAFLTYSEFLRYHQKGKLSFMINDHLWFFVLSYKTNTGVSIQIRGVGITFSSAFHQAYWRTSKNAT